VASRHCKCDCRLRFVNRCSDARRGLSGCRLCFCSSSACSCSSSIYAVYSHRTEFVGTSYKTFRSLSRDSLTPSGPHRTRIYSVNSISMHRNERNLNTFLHFSSRLPSCPGLSYPISRPSSSRVLSCSRVLKTHKLTNSHQSPPPKYPPPPTPHREKSSKISCHSPLRIVLLVTHTRMSGLKHS